MPMVANASYASGTAAWGEFETSAKIASNSKQESTGNLVAGQDSRASEGLETSSTSSTAFDAPAVEQHGRGADLRRGDFQRQRVSELELGEKSNHGDSDAAAFLKMLENVKEVEDAPAREQEL